ncbi:MAG: hypothetical protein JWM57_1291 [Phycisphaerales bacterium]|nr:hypothetical protein [Phycisphaerales bacterium]
MNRNGKMLAVLSTIVFISVLRFGLGFPTVFNAMFPAILAVLYFPAEWRGSRWQVGTNLSFLMVWAVVIWDGPFRLDFASCSHGCRSQNGTRAASSALDEFYVGSWGKCSRVSVLRSASPPERRITTRCSGPWPAL